MKKHKTYWPELFYTKIEPGCWRFLSEGGVVGPIYPTKELLLADMVRYGAESWGFSV